MTTPRAAMGAETAGRVIDDGAAQAAPSSSVARRRRLEGPAGWVVMVLTGMGILASMNQSLPILPIGFRLLSTSFYYLLIGLFLACVFLAYPARVAHEERRPSIVDWALSCAALGTGLYFAVIARTIIGRGWDMFPPPLPAAVSALLCVLAVEGARRVAGLPLALICLVFGVYPLVADSMPGVLWGNSFTPVELVAAHAMGMDSLIGIPLRIVADLLIGFVVFGVALTISGGGEFFMNLATALMGHRRGGAAKVSVLASGFFGSLSGSVVSNIITTGTFTIPAMKRGGYPSRYAAAVEACASTGGTLMPPVMGAAAFLMASFLNTDYATVVMAAIVPSLLFYAALLLQADGYAARHGLAGMDKNDLPRLFDVLSSGWVFILSLTALVYTLLGLHLEAYAPWIATGVLFAGGIIDPRYRARLLNVGTFLLEAGRALGQLIGTLTGIGLVVGAFSITGVGSAFSRELVQYAGGNVYLLLFFGAITSFVLGMGMTVSACYVFLAVVLAPALIQGGLDPLASHLYILYWGMMSYITPPVAIASIAAASIGGANPLETAVTSMRIGIVLFLVPILFVLEPALIGQGDALHVVLAIVTAGLAVTLLCCALSGYLYGHGRLAGWRRGALFVAAVLTLFPLWWTDVLGLVVAGILIVIGRSTMSQTGERVPSGPV